jgi:hypothetical protein
METDAGVTDGPMDGMLGTMPSLGMFLVIILSASVVGSEYGLGYNPS